MSNLNDVRTKGTPIMLNDGVERELKFTLNALAELEDRYGTVEKAFEALEANSIKAIRLTLWAGLLHTDEGLTEQQVGNLIDVTSLDRLVVSVTQAFGNDMPENDSTEGTDPNA